MISSKRTMDRFCCGPSNSSTARASWSCAAWTSRWAASAAPPWARARADPTRTKARAPPNLRIPIACTFREKPMLLLPEPQHLLGAVVVDEDGAVRAEGESAGPLHLGGGECRQELALLVEDHDSPLLVRHVG